MVMLFESLVGWEGKLLRGIWGIIMLGSTGALTSKTKGHAEIRHHPPAVMAG